MSTDIQWTSELPRGNRGLGRTPLVVRYAEILEEIRAHPGVWAYLEDSPLFAAKGVYRRATSLNKYEEKPGKWDATVHEDKGYLRWSPE